MSVASWDNRFIDSVEHLYSKQELRVRRLERDRQKQAAQFVRRLLVVPFAGGLGLAVWEITRPMPTPVLVVLAAVLMVPLLCTWGGRL